MGTIRVGPYHMPILTVAWHGPFFYDTLSPLGFVDPQFMCLEYWDWVQGFGRSFVPVVWLGSQ